MASTEIQQQRIERMKRNWAIYNLVACSLQIFMNQTPEEKIENVKLVKKNLDDNDRAMESIGTGYDQGFVIGGKMFLRLVSLYKLV